MFEDILLQPEQEELLCQLVEAERALQQEKRQAFRGALSVATAPYVKLEHPGLPEQAPNAYAPDIEVLGEQGLLMVDKVRGQYLFLVKPLGYRYYEKLKRQEEEPVRQVETYIQKYLDADLFGRKYPTAFEKWTDANESLWSADSEQDYTTVGHLCREAVQAFATALVERYQPPKVDKNKASDKSRIRAVLRHQSDRLGKTERRYLEALERSWDRLSDLVQRQEHGAQREGEGLVWEDARRVVFQSANLMFEVDRSLSRTVK